ncbi:hypothetical protein [Fusobacterium sp.]|uniref:hypothetical protein n=1 Tax=Fusobacterium sp. TaxID=68766 RepID=UPI0026323BDD|nr:hypothetical protein [Fusobacterium sp.]
MERLSLNEVSSIIKELKETNQYEKYQDMILDDFENHQVVYTLDSDEIIALAYKNKTIPFKMLEFYNWHEMNVLIAEELD